MSVGFNKISRGSSEAFCANINIGSCIRVPSYEINYAESARRVLQPFQLNPIPGGIFVRSPEGFQETFCVNITIWRWIRVFNHEINYAASDRRVLEPFQWIPILWEVFIRSPENFQKTFWANINIWSWARVFNEQINCGAFNGQILKGFWRILWFQRIYRKPFC